MPPPCPPTFRAGGARGLGAGGVSGQPDEGGLCRPVHRWWGRAAAGAPPGQGHNRPAACGQARGRGGLARAGLPWQHWRGQQPRQCSCQPQAKLRWRRRRQQEWQWHRQPGQGRGGALGPKTVLGCTGLQGQRLSRALAPIRGHQPASRSTIRHRSSSSDGCSGCCVWRRRRRRGSRARPRAPACAQPLPGAGPERGPGLAATRPCHRAQAPAAHPLCPGPGCAHPGGRQVWPRQVRPHQQACPHPLGRPACAVEGAAAWAPRG